jgi:hypothetical protein
MQQPLRARVLRWFACAGHLERADARDMAGWHHGGRLQLRPLRLTPMRPALVCTGTSLSLDASVRIEGHDRAALERLLRYRARPPLALERLELVVGEDPGLGAGPRTTRAGDRAHGGRR